MYADEMLAVLRQHLHPRWLAVGVLSHRWGVQARHSVGMVPAGTLWFCNADGYTDVLSIPMNELPYSTIRPSLDRWDNEWSRFRGSRQIVRGWRSTLDSLVNPGCLRPSEALSRLIGRDTHKLISRRYRLT